MVVGIKGDEIISGERKLPDGYEAWIVKFHTSQDKGDNEGLMEEAYARMLRLAKINIPETKLLAVDDKHYFAIKRFDRHDGHRLHMHSLAGLINADFRTPDFDYKNLIKLTSVLTKNHGDASRVYRQMIFNILSSNQDDHTKNFSFVMDGAGVWRLSPAYDITFSRCHGGEQTMSVDGFGRNIPQHVFYALGEMCGLGVDNINQIFSETFDALSQWGRIAADLHIDDAHRKEIQEIHNDLFALYGSMSIGKRMGIN